MCRGREVAMQLPSFDFNPLNEIKSRPVLKPATQLPRKTNLVCALCFKNLFSILIILFAIVTGSITLI